MKVFAAVLVAAFLVSACAGISDGISEKTGTTLEQRCANYATGVTVAEIAFKNDPSDDSKIALSIAKALLAQCPRVK